VKKTIRRVRVPGYVLVRMELTDHSWGVVRHTPGVTGFVGQDAYNPVPLRMDEVFDMLLPVFEEQQQSQGLPVSKPVIESDYTVGENVRVKSGAFEGMDATVSEIKGESQQIVVMISVFGRDTPVTLSFTEIEKI
jgi:transcription termination/antitermination factor NusG